MEFKSKQLAEYFKSNSGYTKLLKGIKNKYIHLGEIKGNVVINNPNELEKQALSGLMKKDYSKNKTLLPDFGLGVIQKASYRVVPFSKSKDTREIKRVIIEDQQVKN